MLLFLSNLRWIDFNNSNSSLCTLTCNRLRPSKNFTAKSSKPKSRSAFVIRAVHIVNVPSRLYCISATYEPVLKNYKHFKSVHI